MPTDSPVLQVTGSGFKARVLAKLLDLPGSPRLQLCDGNCHPISGAGKVRLDTTNKVLLLLTDKVPSDFPSNKATGSLRCLQQSKPCYWLRKKSAEWASGSGSTGHGVPQLKSPTHPRPAALVCLPRAPRAAPSSPEPALFAHVY